MTLHLFKKSREYSHALSGVIMTGELGKGAVALRDIIRDMVVQLQLDISAQNVKSKFFSTGTLSFLLETINVHAYDTCS